MLKHSIVTIDDLKKIKYELILVYEKSFENPKYNKYLSDRMFRLRRLKAVKTQRGKDFHYIKMNKAHMEHWQPFYNVYYTAFKMLYAEHGVLNNEEIQYLNDFYEFLVSFKLY